MCTTNTQALDESISEVTGYKVLIRADEGHLESAIFSRTGPCWSQEFQEARAPNPAVYYGDSARFHIFKWYWQALYHRWQLRHSYGGALHDFVIHRVRGREVDNVGRAYGGRVYLAKRAALAGG